MGVPIDTADERIVPTGGRVSPLPTAPASAVAIFGSRLSVAEAYARSLATDGVLRGLIGPRETPRLWERHLLNCAVVAELVQGDARVIDVGSGAGLPGIPIALARPDLTVTLLDPLARRTAFLDETVQRLELADVRVLRGRAEDWHGRLLADVVIARAVGPLDRLADWCLPLVAPGGVLLAIKGASAAAELSRSTGAIRRAGGRDARVRLCGVGVVDPPATVVEITKGAGPVKRRSQA